jgi:hypothetical protein
MRRGPFGGPTETGLSDAIGCQKARAYATGIGLDVAEEGLSTGSRRRKLAPHHASHPYAVVDRQPFRANDAIERHQFRYAFEFVCAAVLCDKQPCGLPLHRRRDED